MSVDVLNDAIKIRNQDVFIKQSEFFTKSLISDPVVENKLEKDGTDITGKTEHRHAVKMHKAGNSLLNIKMNNYALQPAFSVELERIAKSQFLKAHVSEILFTDNKVSKHLDKIQNVGDMYNSRNCTLSNNANNVQIGKYNTDAKFRASAIGFPSTFKLDLSENIELDKISTNVFNIRNNDHVISKYKYIKESEKSIASRLRSLVSIEENTEDMPKRISSVIEKKIKRDEVKS